MGGMQWETPSIDIDAILAGRYEVRKELGEGVSARAFEANDRLTDERVVCKVGRFVDSVAGNDSSAFKEEYRKLRRVNSSDVVRVLTYDEHQAPAGRLPMLVMELVEGPTLRDWSDGQPVYERLRSLIRVAKALADLHAADIHHGDLHVGNVLVPEGGRIVLIDPGARRFGSTSSGHAGSTENISPALADDKVALGQLISDVMRDDVPIVAPLVEMLQHPNDRPTAQYVADQLRRIIERAPSILGDDLGRVSNWSTYDVNRRHELYRIVRRARHEAAAQLAYDIRRAAKMIPTMTVRGFESDPMDAETMTDTGSRGFFQSRGLECRTADDDGWSVVFSGTEAFRKPWPKIDDPGAVCTGGSNITRHDKRVCNEQLEMRWDGALTLHVLSGVLRLPADDAWIARCLALVNGERIACVDEPVTATAQSPTALERFNWLNISGDEALRRLLKTYLGPAGEDHLAFSTATSALDTIWTLNESTVPAFLREQLLPQVRQFLMTFSCVMTLNRLDCFAMDFERRRVSVEVLLVPNGGSRKVEWRFDYDFTASRGRDRASVS
ncbi:MAG: Serine/threonine-protein kinase PknA [Myxococcales bacterium]|nr:Serine/threonine-protein kinase PknA [Myxococcales bacterium]